MNEKFFLLPLEKQQRIINAAYKVFSENNYKKAPMADIANEGEISKALLFHYFVNKKELYLYLWDYAVQQIHHSLQEYKVTETTDFFEIIKRSLFAKCKVMRVSPHLYSFSVKAFYETDPEISNLIHGRFQIENERSEDILLTIVDQSNLRSDIDIRLLYREIIWMADGYFRDALLSGKYDTDSIEQDFLRMIEQWKKISLK